MNEPQKTSQWVLTALVAFLILGVIVFFFYEKKGQTPTTDSSFTILMRTNAEFVTAQNLIKENNYTEAIKSYTAALKKTSDPIQQSQIQFKIAGATAKNGDDLAALGIYRQIASDSTNTAIMRASAITAMGSLYYSSYDAAITAGLFKDLPYSAFFVKDDIALSYRHLFDYASTIYPLAIPEAFTANWYASNILYHLATTSPEALSQVQIINTKLKNVDADINRTKDNSNENTLIPIALRYKAMTLGKLARAGITSLQDAENAYKSALDSASVIGPAGSDGYTRYYYALFLNYAYGTKRSSDIETLLQPIYDGAAYLPMKDFFKRSFAITDDANIGPKNISDLTKAVPSFKAYVTTLGWKGR